MYLNANCPSQFPHLYLPNRFLINRIFDTKCIFHQENVAWPINKGKCKETIEQLPSKSHSNVCVKANAVKVNK